MIPYAIAFSISFFFAFLVEKSKRLSKNRYANIMLLLLAVLIIALLAGLREKTVGTDLHIYVDKYFDAAVQSKSVQDFFNAYIDESVEPGYKLLTYAVSRASSSSGLLYFFIELIDASFVMGALWKNRTHCSISLGWVMYLLMFHNYTYNLVRQTMAVCACFYAFTFIRERKLLKHILCLAIAFSFHRSAILMAVTYPLAIFFEKKSKEQVIRWILIITIATIAGMLSVNIILSRLIDAGTLPNKFRQYIGMEFSFSRLSAVLYSLPAIILFLLYQKQYFKADRINTVMLMYAILWPITAQLDSVSGQLGRMSFWFMTSSIYIYSQFGAKGVITKNMTNRYFIVTCIILYGVFYWYLNFALFNTGETVPYLFGF